MLKGNHLLLVLAVLGVAAGCASAPPQVVVDPSLANAEVYDVEGLSNRSWGKPIKFGPFHTEHTRVGEKSWDWAGKSFAGGEGAGKGTRSAPYRFVFVGEKGGEGYVDCRANTPVVGWHTRDEEGSVAIGKTLLGCALRDPAGVVHPLSLQGAIKDFHGVTRFGDAGIDIRSLHDLMGADGQTISVPAPLGYELRQGDRVLASVDLMDKGRVYLARELPAELRDPVAMTVAVLLLFEK
jgi:hypothetical protein